MRAAMLYKTKKLSLDDFAQFAAKVTRAPPSAPTLCAAMKLDAGGAMRPPAGHTAIMLPVFRDEVDVILETRHTHTHVPEEGNNVLHDIARWPPNMALWLHDKALIVHHGSIRFVHLVCERPSV
jgi:hypothetical protein